MLDRLIQWACNVSTLCFIHSNRSDSVGSGHRPVGLYITNIPLQMDEVRERNPNMFYPDIKSDPNLDQRMVPS